MHVLLQEAEILCHPFVIGELACGNMRNRREFLSLLQALPQAPTADKDEVLHFIESNQLMGVGIGLVNVHLLASSRLSGSPLWTLDRRLKQAAARLNIAYK